MKHQLLTVLTAAVLTAGNFGFFARADLQAATMPEDVVVRTSPHVDVALHYKSRFEAASKTLEKRARVTIPKLEYRLGIEHMPHINVWLLSDLNQYYTWNKLLPQAPRWAVGLSLVNKQTVLVMHGLGPNRQNVNIEKTFEHELAHVAMDIAREGHHVPLWFNEGFASHHAGEWTLERSELVARSAAMHQLIPLRDLDKVFPSHESHTSLAYAQSTHFVRQLADKYGSDIFLRILKKIRRGETFSVAFTLATGHDFEVVERQWRTGLAKKSSILSGWADGSILFFGASLLFLVAFAVRRRRKRAKFELLDDDVEGWDYDPLQYRLPKISSAKHT